MLKINFYPDSDKEELIKAAREYQEIWNDEGERIVNAFRQVTGLNFENTNIKALVYRGIPTSRPLKFRDNYDKNKKIGSLIHELSHILLSHNGIKVFASQEMFKEELHKVINLFFFDTMVTSFGVDFANNQVSHEKSFNQGAYKNAWEWALQFSKEERAKKFAEFVEKSTLKSV